MSKLPWKPILAWILAAFFVFGAAVNISAPESVAADYQRWGYPDWFHFATGGLELATAVLLAQAGTRRARDPGHLGLAAQFLDDGCCRVHALNF